MVHTSDARVKLSRTRHLHPDVTVSCDVRDREQDAFLLYPMVVCEVLSPSTQTKDRGSKLLAYQTVASLQEIVLVASKSLRVERYRRQRERGNVWTYEIVTEAEGVLELASLGIELPLSVIYEDTALWAAKGQAAADKAVEEGEEGEEDPREP